MRSETHVLEYPGGYTRSTGPVIGRFLTELRDGRLYGIRAASGRVLVPPTEYDPATGEPVTDEWVPVGPGGVVETFAWVALPRAKHPFDRPFAWALIKLDGADTALLHAVDLGVVEAGTAPPKSLRVGMRVRARFSSQPVGSITDISCFVPEVTGIIDRSRIEYHIQPGQALARFLAGIAEGRFLGSRCDECGKVYVPLRVTCPAEGAPMAEEVVLPSTGTLTTFSVNNLPDPRAPEVPFVTGYIMLDGADIAILALVGGIPADQVRMGMRVRAVWADELGPTMASVKWFEPLGEPDVDT